MQLPKAIPKAIQEIFNSQAKECENLVQDLAAHEAKWPDVKAAAERVDLEECIPTAQKFSSARFAGSPTSFALEGQLKQARWKRDGIVSTFRRERDRLHDAIERLTAEPIRVFHQEGLDAMKGLSSLYQFTRDEPVYDYRRDVRMVTVRHNSQALGAARDLIMQRIHEVDDMRHSSLTALREKIAQCRTEIAEFDVTTLEVETVNETRAHDLAPKPPEASNKDVTYIFGPRPEDHISIKAKDTGKIGELKDRITKLEGGPL